MAANIREAYQTELKGAYQAIKQAVQAADLINGYHMDPEMKKLRTAKSVEHNLGIAITGIALAASQLNRIIRKFDDLGSFESELVESNYQGWTKEELEQYYKMLVYKAPSDLEERMPPEMHGVWQQVCRKAFGNYRIEASSVAKLYKQAYYILKKGADETQPDQGTAFESCFEMACKEFKAQDKTVAAFIDRYTREYFKVNNQDLSGSLQFMAVTADAKYDNGAWTLAITVDFNEGGGIVPVDAKCTVATAEWVKMRPLIVEDIRKRSLQKLTNNKVLIAQDGDQSKTNSKKNIAGAKVDVSMYKIAWTMNA